MHHNTTSPKVVLYAMEDGMASELRGALKTLAANLQASHFGDLEKCLSHVRESGSHLVFCPFGDGLVSLLHAVSANSPNVPVIAVSHRGEVHEWLDAIEAGAADYCSTPFEPMHLKWILQSNLHPVVEVAR